MKRYCWLFAVLVGMPFSASVLAQDPEEDLAQQTAKILERRCLDCHNGPGSSSGREFDVLDSQTLKRPSGKRSPVVVPGKPSESRLWRDVESGRMPDGGPELPDSEKTILRKWIEQGTPDFVIRANRPFLSIETVLTAVRDDLKVLRDLEERYKSTTPKRTKPLRKAANQRYFTFAHLHNNNAILDDQLPLYRAALAKAINSLSWSHNPVVPRPIDKTNTLYAIDVSELGWDTSHLWGEILNRYPYGLRYDNHPTNSEVRNLDKEIRELTTDRAQRVCPQPIVRADWFIATATRPPLYHTLLYDASLPNLRKRTDGANPANPKAMKARDLERQLGIDIRKSFLFPTPERIARAGFIKSGVSSQNRLVERHKAKHGYYWKSYDFKPDSLRIKLTRFPLGPLNLFPEDQHPFERHAFIHDGGEIIFSLPNGMQGYLLTDGEDNRIDAGPITVVADSKRVSGTYEVVNGVSCMACHRDGLLDFQDAIRNSHSLLGFGKEAEHIARLYPKSNVMAAFVERDRTQFVAQQTKLLTKVLDKDAKIQEHPEPIGVVARRYRLEYLDLEAVACELFVSDPKELRGLLGTQEFRRLGLDVLLQEKGVISRLEWEVLDGPSLMQQVAAKLGATPVIPIGK